MFIRIKKDKLMLMQNIISQSLSLRYKNSLTISMALHIDINKVYESYEYKV